MNKSTKSKELMSLHIDKEIKKKAAHVAAKESRSLSNYIEFVVSTDLARKAEEEYQKAFNCMTPEVKEIAIKGAQLSNLTVSQYLENLMRRDQFVTPQIERQAKDRARQANMSVPEYLERLMLNCQNSVKD